MSVAPLFPAAAPPLRLLGPADARPHLRVVHAPVPEDEPRTIAYDDLTPEEVAPLYAARHGFAVFPLAPQSKEPWAKSHGFRDATDDPRAVEARFAARPESNIGVATVASWLVVLDVDPRHGGDDTLADLCARHGDTFTKTVTALTPGGGQHLYLALPPGCQPRRDLGVGIDVTSYVVAPPSRTRAGVYRWEVGYAPGECDIVDAPEWLLAPPASAPPPPPPKAASARPAPEALRDARPGTMRGEALGALAGEPAYLEAAARLIGLPTTTLGKKFRGVLRDDRKPSAALYRNRNDHFVYTDFNPPAPDLKSLLLAEVYAAQKYRRVARLSAPELAVWTLRIAVEGGLCAPARVDLPPLPPGLNPSVRTVYEGIRLLFGCRWLHTPGDPAPMTWRFLQAWCGVAQTTAAAANQALVAASVLRVAGGYTVRGRVTCLYLPGAGREG